MVESVVKSVFASSHKGISVCTELTPLYIAINIKKSVDFEKPHFPRFLCFLLIEDNLICVSFNNCLFQNIKNKEIHKIYQCMNVLIPQTQFLNIKFSNESRMKIVLKS